MITSTKRAVEGTKVHLDEITSPEFIDQVVRPLAYQGYNARGDPTTCKTWLVQGRPTGRVTVGYLFEDGISVFGKLYPDELGNDSIDALKALWKGGFGGNEPYQVSQPLAYVSEHKLLLTKSAEGTQLTHLIDRNDPELLDATRQAARWLVRLHRNPLRFGQPESWWESLRLFKLLRRLAQTAATIPQEKELLGEMVDMVDSLSNEGEKGSCKMKYVQTHGRYHHEHIFIDRSTTTLIDLDGSHPSDPSKDLAEFLTLFRFRVFKKTGSTALADPATLAFLDEYLSHLPGNEENLAVFWGTAVLASMFRHAKRYPKKYPSDPESFERLKQYYKEEFESAISGKFVRS